jgi:deoxyribodipyrimidine photo-lyase
MSLTVVWFKRDLRLTDHRALCEAAARGAVLPVYVVEPAQWSQPDMSRQHYRFMLESLRSLADVIADRGGQLQILVGDAVEAFARLHARLPFDALHAHEETGNGQTYRRDIAVGQWCRQQGVDFREWPQNGVVRRLATRDHWADHWEKRMNAACLPLPVVQWQPAPWPEEKPLRPSQLALAPADPPHRQKGGREHALVQLQSFLSVRSGQYRGGISSPLSAPTACSRLSPYLAWGCVSLREALHATDATLQSLDENEIARRKGLEAFISRLHWHCHFIQKLESEPAIEFHNMHRGYDGLREPEFNAEHFHRLTTGTTGWPLVDACVAMLKDSGWLNFRMRAMLVSVAAYPLWLHWREVGLWLATWFLDYEPGIHWSQLQMQSGTTGINTTRIYNPVKQALDHDPKGIFVRRWLPVMREVPDSWLFEPWKMPSDLRHQIESGTGHPLALPIVDLEQQTRLGKERMHALRRDADMRDTAGEVARRHGSRKRTRLVRSDISSTTMTLHQEKARQKRKPEASAGTGQMDLPL